MSYEWGRVLGRSTQVCGWPHRREKCNAGLTSAPCNVENRDHIRRLLTPGATDSKSYAEKHQEYLQKVSGSDLYEVQKLLVKPVSFLF